VAGHLTREAIVRRACLLLLLFAGGVAWGAEPPKIVGETKVAPYRIVRLKVENLPAKAGLMWKVRPLSPDAKPDAVDWATGRNVQKPEWVAPPGDYRVELTVVTIGADGAPVLDGSEVVVTIVGPGPTPPPVPPGPTPPGPTPPGPTPPGPTPGPAPIPLPGLRVLLVTETDANHPLTAGQREVLRGRDVRDFLRGKCVTNAANPDGAWRIIDQHTDQTQTGDPDGATWAEAMKRPRTSVPWVVISNGTAGYEGPLPPDTNATKFKELVGRYAQ
jgi:hypothetical protein